MQHLLSIPHILFHLILRTFEVNNFFLSLGFFFSPSFLADLWHIEFPGQGSGRSPSCDLCHSCGSMESLTHYAGPENKSVTCTAEARFIRTVNYGFKRLGEEFSCDSAG